MTAPGTRTNEEARVRSVVEDLANAVRSKDAAGVVSHFAEETVMFVLAPPLQFNAKNSPGAKGVAAWFSTFDGPIGYDIRDQRIIAGDDVAFSHALVRISGTRKKEENTGTEDGQKTASISALLYGR
jgi:PhnB protein